MISINIPLQLPSALEQFGLCLSDSRATAEQFSMVVESVANHKPVENYLSTS